MKWVASSLVVLLVGCTGPLQGPVMDLDEAAKPDSVPPVVLPSLPPSVPGPTAPTGSFRAWVPRQTAPNGDTVDGHWMLISLTPPAVETVEPQRPIPRVPHTKVERAKPPTVQVPVSQLPPGLVPSPPGMHGER